MINDIKNKIGLFFHNHLERHRPLEGSIYFPWLSIYKYATCKYCGKCIMEASFLGDWMIINYD